MSEKDFRTKIDIGTYVMPGVTPKSEDEFDRRVQADMRWVNYMFDSGLLILVTQSDESDSSNSAVVES